MQLTESVPQDADWLECRPPAWPACCCPHRIAPCSSSASRTRLGFGTVPPGRTDWSLSPAQWHWVSWFLLGGGQPPHDHHSSAVSGLPGAQQCFPGKTCREKPRPLELTAHTPTKRRANWPLTKRQTAPSRAGLATQGHRRVGLREARGAVPEPLLGLLLWHKRSSYRLQHQHPVWKLV